MPSDPSWSREIIYKFYFYNLFLRQQIFGFKITRFQSGVTESHRKRILLQRYPKPTSDNISKRYRNSLYSFVTCLFVFSDWTTVLVRQLGLHFERISKWSDSVTFKWFSLMVVSDFIMWDERIVWSLTRSPDYVTKGRLLYSHMLA